MAGSSSRNAEGGIRILRGEVIDPVPATVIEEVLVTAVPEGGRGPSRSTRTSSDATLYAVYTVQAPEGSR